MASRPTEKQKKFARDLGIDFPEGVTKSEISNLIDHELYKQKEIRREKFEEGVAKVLSKNNIRFSPGVIIQSVKKYATKTKWDYSYVVIKILEGLKLQVTSTKSCNSFPYSPFYRDQDGVVKIACEIIFTPPPNFAHKNMIRKIYDMDMKFKDYLEKNILSHEKFTNEHGIFYSVSAAERCFKEWNGQLKEQLFRAKKEKLKKKIALGIVKKGLNQKFCTVCGKKIMKSGQSQDEWRALRKCNDCKNRRPAENYKYCCYCGSKIIRQNENGISWTGKILCSSCKESHHKKLFQAAMEEAERIIKEKYVL